MYDLYTEPEPESEDDDPGYEIDTSDLDLDELAVGDGLIDDFFADDGDESYVPYDEHDFEFDTAEHG